MTNPYAAVKFKMRAEIGDKDAADRIIFEDVVGFTASFELNAIPEGAITVAVGKDVDTEKVATIHQKVNDFKIQLPIRVFLEARVVDIDRAHAGVEWFDVDGGQLIFEGYAVGTGWHRGLDSANFTIHMLHWLVDLHYGSAISASAHPSNPADWKYPAMFKAVGLSAAEAAGGKNPSEPSWVPMVRTGDVTVASISGAAGDLWGKVLLKWMEHVSQDDPIETRLAGGQNNDISDRSLSVLAALARMGPNPDGKPLSIEMGGADGEVIATGIRLALQNESGNTWIHTTLWSKLVGEWSPAYWFAVIPRVNDALIVPFAGALQGDPWAVIGAEDYDSVDANAQLHQVLRAVGICYPQGYATGFDGRSSPAIGDRTGLAGWFQPAGLTKGLVLVKDAPPWLCDPNSVHTFSANSTGLATNSPIGTTLDEEEVGPDKVPDRDPADTQTRNAGLLNKFAQHWYAVEMLKGRVGEISGKLRFDITPGSNIQIIAGRPVNISAGEDSLQEDIFATVTRVSYTLIAEGQRAGTAFSLAHIRNARENRQPETSIDKPPLYRDKWIGAALVPGVKIEQIGD
jgi:hypothetical protein